MCVCTVVATATRRVALTPCTAAIRSAQQLDFHAAFMKASARVIYRSSWATDRPAIMAAHGWETSNSEVLISTPRRFGKTFSIAIFCACLALAQGLEIVVFSPARRASRKLLERIVEFINLAGGHDKICEYNQARWAPAPAARRAAADPHSCGDVRRRLAG